MGGAAMNQAVAADDARDSSVIDLQNATLPSQPAQGQVLGRKFYVRRAKIENADLVLKGDETSDLPEIRLHTLGRNQFAFSIPPLVENAVRFRIATLVLGNGSLGGSFSVTVRTPERTTDLTADSGIRLVFQAPENGTAKTSIDLGFGRLRKEWIVGEFVTELSPELAAKVRNIKPAFGAPDFRRCRTGRHPSLSCETVLQGLEFR
jgi:hypothetical protein